MWPNSLKFKWKPSLELVIQSENSECGLACLTMIANYHGNHSTLAQLRSVLSNTENGVNLKQLMEQASSVGLIGRAIKVELEQLPNLTLPCILHWDFNHFVVLKKVGPKNITIADPAFGLRVIAYKEVSDHFTGVALELTKSNDFTKKKPTQKLKLFDFMRHIVGLKRHLALLSVLSVMLQAAFIAGPFYMQSVIDLVIIDHDMALLKVLAFGFAMLLFFELVTQFIREKVALHFSSRLNLSMSQSVFDHLIRLPTSYFQKRHMGDIVSRFSGIHQVRELITSGIVTAFIDGLMAIVTLIVMAIYSIKLTLVVLAVITLYAVIRWLSFAPIQRLNRESIQAYANENAYFMQSVRAIKTIKLSAKESATHEKWSNHLTNALNKDIRIAFWGINLNTTNNALFGIENLVVVFIAATLVMSNDLSVGMLFAFISYKSKFITASNGLINKFIEFKMLNVHLSRLADILHTEPESLSGDSSDINTRILANVSELNRSQHLLDVSDLSFSYTQSDKYIFKNISFSLKAGENIAIVGQSGCGKSTLLLCLLGLLSSTSGTITYSGQRLSAKNRKSQQIAAVLQEDQLLNGSIIENISNFDSHVDLSQVAKAAQLACLHDDIMEMTMQYQSLIGDMGDTLSGGQRQRLILARALYKQPKILMLDEATSHLDLATEIRINQHLKALNISKITIAHRIESIRHADKILALQDGSLSDVTSSYIKEITPKHG